ncbi:nitric-oxide reductase large subunit [Sphingomonadaceae bacterium G21617-S1]|uniref:nitric-oxide reductase large subunit n=2 Tax=Sphingomonadales TaxID=204457 RepID=UPI000A0B5F73|nr:nitric-oxide reductase large subunit [Novosphingobium sp. LASN5T]MCF8708665.1 nitric-oxide reductase large subunit [Rhizorhapis sp. SPR117]MCZ4341399.1 nitric-oxide reductase large subunit [Sphingomonadaceae bacterium G21617-S1]OQW40650.1 MAG: nitric oxide reductase large subunit [Proteobacteria bacterium SG_bin5]RQW42493.1 nitric-oxide reductase large subunit [Novosphingobium sp. LASN5T]
MKSYQTTFSIKRLWIILSVGMVVMFGILLLLGQQIYQQAPPIPEAVKSQSGETLFTRADIETGQNIWQSIGGMEQGSIWGHGSYLAPDWSADWLHREAEALLALSATPLPAGVSPTQAEAMRKAALQEEMRRNSYDPASGAITVSDTRARAIRQVQQHFVSLYDGGDPASLKLRRDYAFPVYGELSAAEARQLTAFYFWTAWGATTDRPGQNITYTSNWPHEPLVGNSPTTGTLLWSLASVILLLAAAGALIAYYAKQFDVWRGDILPEGGMATSDLLGQAVITPSMRATAKYFWVVCALFVGQVLLGIVTAHYAVEGQGLYGLPFAEYLPYTITRTWHTQLAVLWIATAWLATGLYVAPMLGGRDPKFQRLGVNFLFVSLLVIVIGSFAGQWAAVHRFFTSLTANFWFGHQGYEYVDLGRFWQIYLLIGLFLWVALVVRALWPVLRREGGKSLIYLVLVSALAIGLLYGAGLMWGQHTNIAIMEYWRWWVVHLWVEGIFEVFATAIISLLFVQMGILRTSTATVMVLFATIIFLFGGVLGTFHHLYFSGTPTSVIAVGAMISALEVVPLLVVGFEAYTRHKVEHEAEWERIYHWPFMFFAAVLFWNLVGAGLFGFLINPPIALYYMQGLNTTANHGHAALFGVYGMLGLGLTLYCMRGLTDVTRWNLKWIRISFWSLNIGLGMMTFLSLLPQGILQTYASIEHGYAYARSAEFIHSPIMQALVWARVPGDVVFAFGVFAFAWFMVQAFMHGRKPTPETVAIPKPAL